MDEKNRSRLRSIIHHLTFNQRLVLTGVVVGLSVGASAYLFEELIDFLFEGLKSFTAARPWPLAVTLTLLLPALGALLSTLLTTHLCPEAKGHGSTEEVYRAIHERGGVIRGRVAWVKFLASACTIGFGGSAGREGPIIHIGAAVGSKIGQWMRVSNDQLKMMVAAGAAGGLSATFSVPMAGVFFIMEVLLKNFANEAFPAAIIASVTGTVTASLLSHNNSTWATLPYHWNGLLDFLNFAVVGILGAVLGVTYNRTLKWSEHRFDNEARIPQLWKPVIGGLAVGAMALALPEVRGTGQSVIQQAMLGVAGGWKTLLYPFGKIAATALTLGSGASGGALMPAMFIGSMGGAAWAILLGTMGVTSIQAGPLAVAGLSCVVTAAFDAPITGMIMALEMTKDFGILSPVMFACAITYLLTRSAAKPE